MPLRIIQKPAPGFYKVRAYCTECHRMLSESNPLTQKQLIENWNDTVLGALSFSCKDCGIKAPNVHIELRIVDTRFNTEVLPENCSFLKVDVEEGKEAYNKFIAKMRDQARSEYIGAKEDADEAQKELDEALKNSAPIAVDVLEDGSAVLPVDNVAEVIKDVATKRRSRGKKVVETEVTEDSKEEGSNEVSAN